MRSAFTTRCAASLLAAALSACSSTTEPLTDVVWSEVAAGDLFTCGLTSDGAAWCWGAGVFGQLGNGDAKASGAPVAVVGEHVFHGLAVGSDHACALDEAGAAWCWGLNDYRELGNSGTSCNATFIFVVCSKVPLPAVGGLSFTELAVAGYSTCGLSGSAAYCWGWNDHGQVGSGAIRATINQPTAVGGNRHFKAITLDISHACGRTTGDTLFCWGSNIYGQLGADTGQTPRCGTGTGFYCTVSPVRAAASLAVAEVSAGSTHTCALTVAGEAWCWGSNDYGVLGNPSSLGGRTPVAVAGGPAYLTLSAGADHTCALTQDGAAWCWGLNQFGQLGVATVAEACPAFGSARACRTSAGLVPGVPPLAHISAGTGHTCGLTSDGALYCWGRGTEGQLGTGTYTSSSTALAVAIPHGS